MSQPFSIESAIQEVAPAVLERNPLLAEKLQPGLRAGRMRKSLERSGISGALEPIELFYSWRNGTLLDRDLVAERAGFFPGEVFHFIELQRAINDFELFREGHDSDPRNAKLSMVAGRFFPMFWDGNARWIAVDLEPSGGSRIILIDILEQGLPKTLCDSFTQFLEEVARSNRDGSPLPCMNRG